MSESYRVVFVTVASADEGERIASALVENHLAACVNVIGGCRSIYRWEGKIVRDEELLLIVKTHESKLVDLEAKVKELHSYAVPEIVAVRMTEISESYRRFLADTLRV